jgi:hypothetical protein
MLRVERHLLDEPQFVAMREREREQGQSLVFVEITHEHCVDLDRPQPGGGRGGQSLDYVGQPVTARQLAEDLGAQRVQRDVDPVQAGRPQRRGQAVQADPVGGQRDLRARRQRGGPLDNGGQAATQQRLAAGEPDLSDAEPLYPDPDQPEQFIVSEQFRLRQPVQTLRRHAVRTAQVAPVGQRHPQVRRYPSVGVRQHRPSLRAGTTPAVSEPTHKHAQRESAAPGACPAP